jgi:DNA-directed RNA polymerase specialized sigma24 family protein
LFPTTIWTTIRAAGAADADALERFACAYRGPVLRFVRARGLAAADAEDLCHEVFIRLLSGGVLARADARLGRFRSLLLGVTRHALADRARKRGEACSGELDPMSDDPEFDREWVIELTERALRVLEHEGSSHHRVLREHLAGVRVDRNKLWLARQRLVARIRHEVALTCSSAEALERELEHLSPYLRPRSSQGAQPLVEKKKPSSGETDGLLERSP